MNKRIEYWISIPIPEYHNHGFHNNLAEIVTACRTYSEDIGRSISLITYDWDTRHLERSVYEPHL